MKSLKKKIADIFYEGDCTILLKRDTLWILGLFISGLGVIQIDGPTIFTWGTIKITLGWILGTSLLLAYGIVWSKSDRKSRWKPREQP